MATILLVHGPNLNLLGARNTAHYGTLTLADIEELVSSEAQKSGWEVKAFQSNHEGVLIDWIQKESPNASGIIINPGAFGHSSYALHDALLDAKIPAVEVHLSDISNREEWRRTSITASACIGVISGKKEKGYVEAVALLQSKLADV